MSEISERNNRTGETDRFHAVYRESFSGKFKANPNPR